jgi:dihydroflavonol-4-reductase
MSQNVLVTGATGFIAKHCIKFLLEAGYQVRGTMRSPASEPALRQLFSGLGFPDDRLKFFVTDLTKDDGWAAAVAGCDYVVHVASPVLNKPPKHEDEAIIPARDGTLRVLRAAAAAGVRRVVLTSSVSAISEGHRQYQRRFTEADWSDLTGKIQAYGKSKTLAEKAAWDFSQGPEAGQMELVTICPGYVFGPVLDDSRVSPSIDMVRRSLLGEYPGSARLSLPTIDVRDLAAAHVAALVKPELAGERLIAVKETIWQVEFSQILAEAYGPRGYKVPTRQLPDFLVKVASLFDPQIRLVVDMLGKEILFADRHSRALLGEPRYSARDAILATAESLIAHGIV